jgi:hypothetical protein
MTVGCAKCGVTIPEGTPFMMCPICKGASTILCIHCEYPMEGSDLRHLRPCRCGVAYEPYRL